MQVWFRNAARCQTFWFSKIFVQFWFFVVKVCPIPRAAELTATGTGSARVGSRYSRRAPLHAASLTCSSAKISSLPEWETHSLQGYVWLLSQEL